MTAEKVGGQIELDNTLQQKYSQRRHRYPCSVCTTFNSPQCERCKCDSCQVFEDKCPKCKNIPKTLSQYQVMHGIANPGENWEAADLFTCQRCGISWKVTWERTPSYNQCPRCNTVYYLYPYFTSGYKGCLRGAKRPGLNWDGHDVFKCTACNQYFYVAQKELPGNHQCSCGRTFYCYKSTTVGGSQKLVAGSKKVMKNVSDAFRL